MKITIDNVYMFGYGSDIQGYVLTLELMDNTTLNEELWDVFFAKIDDGEPVTITIERKEDE
jgi:hypothetical protein